MKKVTITIDEHLYDQVSRVIPRGKFSHVVSKALSKFMAEKKDKLELSYLAASKDNAREKELCDWDKIDSWD